MTNKKTLNATDQSKRKALGALGGVAIVGVWHKPIVDVIISPAHAMLSAGSDGEPTDGLPDSYFDDALMGPGDGGGGGAAFLDLLVSPVHAGVMPVNGNMNSNMNGNNGNGGGGLFGILAEKASGTGYDVTVLNPPRDVLRMGTLNVDGTPGTLAYLDESCITPIGGGGGDIPAFIDSVDETNMVLVLTLGDGSGTGGGGIQNQDTTFTVPVGPGSLTVTCLVNGNSNNSNLTE